MDQPSGARHHLDVKREWKKDNWVLEPMKADPHGWRVTVEKVNDNFWKVFAAFGGKSAAPALHKRTRC